MNLLTCILIAIPIGIIFIMLWIYNDYRKYKKKNKLAILLFLLFPTTLSAQYVDAGCQVSFKWLENQKGKLEYTKDGVTYKFIPNDSQWEIIIRNNSSEDIRINWENMQFIVDGRTSEVKYPILAEAETPFAIIKSQAETSQKIGVTTYTANNSQIYNKKDIRKGRNSSITIILPISIGKHPQFFTSFDFIIKKETNCQKKYTPRLSRDVYSSIYPMRKEIHYKNPTVFFNRKLYFKNCRTDAIRTSRYMPTCSH